MVKSGLLTEKKIGNAIFTIDLIPTSNKKARPGRKMTAKYITVHNTGNSKKGAGADNHTEYVDNVDNYVSWHFTVDDKKIYQELPVNEHGWHAGDGNGEGNRASIGIEICENVDGNWPIARKNGILLIAKLLIDLGLTPDKVVPHKHWSGKQCPQIILREGWNEFMNEVKKEYDKLRTPNDTPQEVSSWAKPAWDKAMKKIGTDGKPVNDGIGPKNEVTEEQLMVFFDKLGLLD